MPQLHVGQRARFPVVPQRRLPTVIEVGMERDRRGRTVSRTISQASRRFPRRHLSCGDLWWYVAFRGVVHARTQSLEQGVVNFQRMIAGSLTNGVSSSLSE